MTDSLSVITPCKGRLSFLRRTAPLVVNQPNVEYILVDYSCPENSSEWIAGALPNAKVCSVPGQPGFNLSKARNAGARKATGQWLCFLDVDLIVHKNFSPIVLSSVSESFFCWHPWRNQPGYNGFVVCARSDYERIGGYDERCTGYGWEDSEFFQQLRGLGRQPRLLPHDLFTHIDHGNDVRTQYYEEKNIMASWTRNRGLPERRASPSPQPEKP